ncbi:hypothetical protein Tco_0787045 [Tanacetum coccineum]
MCRGGRMLDVKEGMALYVVDVLGHLSWKRMMLNLLKSIGRSKLVLGFVEGGIGLTGDVDDGSYVVEADVGCKMDHIVDVADRRKASSGGCSSKTPIPSANGASSFVSVLKGVNDAEFVSDDDSVNGEEEKNDDMSKKVNLEDESDIEGVSEMVFGDQDDPLVQELNQNSLPNEKEISRDTLNLYISV